jgi:hypothetical protein
MLAMGDCKVIVTKLQGHHVCLQSARVLIMMALLRIHNMHPTCKTLNKGVQELHWNTGVIFKYNGIVILPRIC